MEERLLLERRLEATATVCTHRHGADRHFCGGPAVARVTLYTTDVLVPTLYLCAGCLEAFMGSEDILRLADRVDEGLDAEIVLLALSDRRN